MLQDIPPREITVSELTAHIKAILESTFPSICVAGEISDVVRARSGHLYFTLKDDQAQIRGVMWRTAVARQRVEIHDGDSVLCFGDIDVYPPRGTYQLVAREIQPRGLGGLQAAFQRLQAKLNAEGLFAAERKRPLPRFPRRIAIVTSPSGAAVRDFLQAAAERWKGVEIVILPAIVQGEGAAASVVAAIQAAHRLRPRPEALVISRGGGSLEDLWCFNEEVVVRAVAASEIPTVSAVGHEIDITLCDLAADVRALTPTDGAKCGLPDAAQLTQSVADLRRRLDHRLRSLIEDRRTKLVSIETRSVFRKPHEIVTGRARALDELDARGKRAVRASLQLARSKVASCSASLSALSPLNVLSRGYSVTLNAAGQTISSPADVNHGDSIRTRLKDGEIESVVKK